MVTSIAPNVDRRIRAAAAHAGLSMEDLAERIAERHPGERTGLSFSNLRELGTKREPKVRHLEILAQATGVPIGYLIGGFDALGNAELAETVQRIARKLGA